MSGIKKHFKKYFRTYRPSKQQFLHYLYQDTNRIEKNSWVLDMGAAKCKNYDIFQEFRYVAADISLESLKSCLHQDIYKVATNILNPGFHKKTFNAVICTHTLSHLKFEDRSRALQKIQSLVKLGGLLIFNIPLKKDDNKKITLREIESCLDPDFVVERRVRYRGVISRFYEATIFNFFTKIKKERGKKLNIAYLFLTHLIFILEYITKLHQVGSDMAYFCLRKKLDNSLNCGPINEDDIIKKLVCPLDSAELDCLNNRTVLRCRRCERCYPIKDGVVILTDFLYNKKR